MLVSPSSLPLDPLSSLWIKPTFRVTRRMATGLFRHFDRHEVSTTERSAKGVGRVEFVPVECNHVNVTTMMLTTRKLPRLKVSGIPWELNRHVSSSDIQGFGVPFPPSSEIRGSGDARGGPSSPRGAVGPHG